MLEIIYLAALEPRVTCRQDGTVGLGEDVTLTCNFLANKDVLQVTWQKKRGKNTQNMVAHSEQYGINIHRRFENHVSVLQANSTISSIQISKLETEDEACYNCLFTVFPEGAYTGEVCLNKLGVVNKVECTARGSDLGVDLSPQRIQTRHHEQHSISGTKRSVQRGEYPETEANIKPNCTFTLHSRARRSRSLHESPSIPRKRADETIVVQCQASGKDKLSIMWQNEGDPISREDKENKTRDVITVTSTLHLSASSLSAEHKINCNFIHNAFLAVLKMS
ncbi:nectin-1-like [Hyperolius riggenbachi]|uniref:nectin-1-like n=1 Tax=Hyperolius riggenbachi TaxID=752182 RepID=UPI0035A38838